LLIVYTKIGQNSKPRVLQCTYTYTVDPPWPSQGTKGEQKANKPRTKEQKPNRIEDNFTARQKTWSKVLYLLHKFTDELSVAMNM